MAVPNLKFDPTVARRAEMGDATAMAELGNIYLKGEGLPSDPQQAMEWFLKGASAGNAAAQVGVGYLLTTGRGGRVNHAEAGKWFLRAAEQNHPKGQHNLAELLAQGKLGPGRMQEAVDWYVKAGMQGHVPSQAALVDKFFFPGSGVPQNLSTAAFWAARAAEAGHAHSQMMFGVMLRDGQGVPPDKARAERFFKLAATQGNPKAMCHLADFLMEAQPPQPVTAGAWFIKAAALGEKGGKDRWEKLKPSLTPGQVEEAERLANALPGAVSGN